MAIIDKNIIAMSMPKAMKRGNAIPLDASTVWYSYAEMAEYAKNGAVAYVGQILSLVDSNNNNAVTAYIIADEAGTLQEVGSATHGDNKTINLEDGVLTLNNWGKEYYKWVEATGVEGEDDYVAAHHERYVLSEGDMWPAGLEPKTATAYDGTVILSWYQPSTTTIEGISSTIASVLSTVETLTEGIGSREDEAGAATVYGAIIKLEEESAAQAEDFSKLQEKLADYLPLTGGQLSGDLTLADGHKVLSEAEIDLKIATAISNSGHLKREVVSTLPPIESADSNTIYMVRDPFAIGGDIYEEFMVISGQYEQIGDSSVNLDGYIKKPEEYNANNLAMFSENGDLLDSGIAAQEAINHIKSVDIHVSEEEKTYWNEARTIAEEAVAAISILENITKEDIDKLAALPAITEIGEGLELIDGTLTVTASVADFPIASNDTAGLVKGSDTNNSVSVDAETGEMTVNSLSVHKLYVDEGDEFVLYGGTSL